MDKKEKQRITVLMKNLDSIGLLFPLMSSFVADKSESKSEKKESYKIANEFLECLDDASLNPQRSEAIKYLLDYSIESLKKEISEDNKTEK